MEEEALTGTSRVLGLGAQWGVGLRIAWVIAPVAGAVVFMRVQSRLRCDTGTGE